MTMRSKFIAMTVALPMMALFPLGVPAAEAELTLLGSYVGSWRGEGALVGGDKPEPFRCRLTVAKGNQGKINYSGRCTLVSATLSISGTIAYSDANNQYEAAMSSNAGFTGIAIGQQNQGRISFDLKERQKDRTGSDVRIGSRILLEGNNSITVDFEVEFNDSGKVLTASVPFSQ